MHRNRWNKLMKRAQRAYRRLPRHGRATWRSVCVFVHEARDAKDRVYTPARIAMSVECPVCRARKGTICRNEYGRGHGPHRERCDLARSLLPVVPTLEA